MGMFDSLFGEDVGGVIDIGLDAAGVATTGIPWGTVAGAVGDLGAAAIGGGLSYAGQSSANDANRQIAQQTNDFNAQQAELSRSFNAMEAQKSRDANAVEAKNVRDWQQYMSNTQYRRAIDDMKAAGLNPMLAYQQGGAGTPSGAVGLGGQASASSASGVSARMENSLGGAGSAVSSVRPSEMALRYAQVKNFQEQNKQIQANTAESESRTRLNETNDLKTLAEMFKTVAEIERVKQETKTSSAAAAHYKSSAAGIDAQRAKDRASQPVWDTIGSFVKGTKDYVQQLTGAK